VATADPVGDDGSSADDGRGSGNGSADNAAAHGSSWTQRHVNLLRWSKPLRPRTMR
jgi:hypothetical protein